MTHADIGIIGSGIAGLTLGYRQQQTDRSVVVLEAGDRPGGVIKTYRDDDWTVELGPNTVRLTDEMHALLSELDLLPDVRYPADDAKLRYIVRKGRLRALPTGPKSLIFGKALSASVVFRLLRERSMGSGELPADEPLSELVRRRFGSEVVDYALNPFVSGVFAGDPDKLSARFALPALYQHLDNHGSILKGFIHDIKARKAAGQPKVEIFTLRGGLERLAERLAEELHRNLHLNQRVERISRVDSAWQVQTADRTYRFKRLINTLPLPALQHIRHEEPLQRALHALPNVEHPPMAMLALGYRNDSLPAPPKGFGFLVPEVEQANILGGIYASSLFPGRAPQGFSLITVFIGGMRQPELARLSEAEQLVLAHQDLERLIGATQQPVFHLRRTWAEAIPQYGLSHGALLLRLAAIEAEFPGYHLLGNYRSGIGVPDRVGVRV